MVPVPFTETKNCLGELLKLCLEVRLWQMPACPLTCQWISSLSSYVIQFNAFIFVMKDTMVSLSVSLSPGFVKGRKVGGKRWS